MARNVGDGRVGGARSSSGTLLASFPHRHPAQVAIAAALLSPLP